MKNALKTIVVMTLAAACGFGIVHAIFRGPSLFASKAQTTSILTLEVEARDTRGRPLANADVTLFAPAAVKLGRTNARGILRGRLTVPAGKVHIVELSGRNFRVRKDLPIATLAHNEARLVFALGKKGRALALRSGAGRVKAKRAREKTNAALDTLAALARPASVPPIVSPEKNIAAAPENAHFPVQIFHGPQGDRTLVTAIAARLRDAAARNRNQLLATGVHRFQLRQLWNEASYVEIVPLAKNGQPLGGYLLRSHKTDAGWLDLALKNMWSRDFAGARGRTLTVLTGRPGEARAYLNGIPIPRRVRDGKAIFYLANHPAARMQNAVLTLTSDDGPLIRSAVSVASLNRDIHWSLPETALSRR